MTGNVPERRRMRAGMLPDPWRNDVGRDVASFKVMGGGGVNFGNLPKGCPASGVSWKLPEKGIESLPIRANVFFMT